MHRTTASVLLAGVLLACLGVTCLAAVYLPPDPHPRFNAQAIFADGKVHWAGGYGNTVTNPISGKTYYNNRQSGYSIYDPATNSWKSSKWSDDPQDPMGIDMNDDGVVGEPEGTYYGECQMFAYDRDGDGRKEIWIHAGYPSWDGNFWVYNPATNRWSKVGVFPGFSDGGYKSQYLGVAALWEQSPTQAWVYCVGGGFWGPDNKSFAKYNIQTDTWTELPDAPFASLASAGAIVNGKLYVAGGNQGADFATAIWEFDCATETWTDPLGGTTPAPVANLLTGVNRAAVGVYNGKLYIIGGEASAGDYDGIQVFDPVTRSVTLLGTLPIGMSRHGGCIDPATGDIYVGAGRQGGAYLSYEPWWKSNVNSTPLVWTALPNDPAYFPYDDWVAGGETLSGLVTGPDGKPMPMALVGIKKTSRGSAATADANYYAITDGTGRYKVEVSPGTYNVAAWRMGYAPSADTPLTMGATPATLDLQITAPAGKNIAPGSVVYFSSQTGGEPAANAIDENQWSRWSTEGGTGSDHYYIIDLGSVKTITGITAWWEDARPGVYDIEITNDDPNPTGSPTWTKIYSCVKGGGGYGFGYGHFADPIGFPAAKTARGIRFHFTAFSQWWQGNYSAWELIIHGTEPVEPPMTIAEAKAKPDDTPVYLFYPVSVSGVGETMNSRIFPGKFWIEELDRSAGLMVQMATGDANAWVGEMDEIRGVMKTDPTTGERYVEASDVQTWLFPGLEYRPLAMPNKALLDSKTWGMYVKTWGKVTEAITNGFKITDGSQNPDGSPLEVTVLRSGPPPVVGSFVTVAGAAGGGPTIYQYPYDGYVRNWLFHGAYSVDDPGGDALAWQQANLNQDFLASVGGEANIQPVPGETGPNGSQWFVSSLKPWESIYGNLSALPFQWSGKAQNTVYAHVWILADRQYTGVSGDGLEIWIGSDDGYRLYWNGTQIAENNIWRGLTRDEDKIPNETWEGGDLYVLNEGWNHILFKINNITGGYGMCVRLMVNDPSSGEKVPLLLPCSVTVY